MIIQYGYTDASGEYYISVNTDNCDGCEDCIGACPKGLLEMEIDSTTRKLALLRSPSPFLLRSASA